VVAPDWKLPVLAMRTNVSLDIERGRVIVLNFWVKNSAPCAAIVPRLGALQAKYSQKNVEVLGINCHDTKQDVIGFMKKYRPHYRILTDGKEISEAYGVNAYPTIVLLDKNGKVLYAGDWDESKVDGLIDKALF
jgi:thiol-disulfide isomerase/thioredoxin